MNRYDIYRQLPQPCLQVLSCFAFLARYLTFDQREVQRSSAWPRIWAGEGLGARLQLPQWWMWWEIAANPTYTHTHQWPQEHTHIKAIRMQFLLPWFVCVFLWPWWVTRLHLHWTVESCLWPCNINKINFSRCTRQHSDVYSILQIL